MPNKVNFNQLIHLKSNIYIHYILSICFFQANKKTTRPFGWVVNKIYFVFLVFQRTQRGEETKSEEIQPDTRPKAIGIQKLRRVVSAKTSPTTIIVTTASKVVIVVIMVLLLT